MNTTFIKKALIYILCFSIIFSLFVPVFAENVDIQVISEKVTAPQYTTNIINNNTYRIGSDITLSKQMLIDSNNNRQNAYIIEFGDDDFSQMLFLNSEHLNQRNSIDSLVNNLDLPEGYITSAMNADFFNMSNGIPESAFIKDGVVLTSDRDNFVLAKNADGKYFFDKPSIKITVSFDDKIYNVLHFNKEFTEYGLYLYNSEFGPSTNINVPTTEVVLFPYCEKLDVYDVCDLYFENRVPYDAVDEIFDEQLMEYVAVISDEYAEEIKVFLDENNILELNGKFYTGTNSDVIIGETYNTVIVEKRENTENFNNKIKEGTFVLSAKTDTQAFKLEKAAVGMDVTISVDANENFYDVVSAIGTGAIIVNNGEVIEHNELSHYSSAQPRTAIGLTEDNRIIMYAVDGRNSKTSKGLTLKQLSYEMIRLGCVIAANLDGGGSTTVKSISFEDNTFKTINTPSDSSDRKISNAIAFHNKLEPTGIAAYSYLNSKSMYILPNSFATLENPMFFDSAFYPIGFYEKINSLDIVENDDYGNLENSEELQEKQEEQPSVNYDIKADTESETDLDSKEDVVQEPDYTSSFTYYSDNGTLDGYTFTPSGYVGKVSIISESENGEQNVAYEFESVDRLDEIAITVNEPSIYVGDSVDFNADGYIFDTKVFGEDTEYTWGVDSQYGIISREGVFTAFCAGENVEVSAAFGDTTGKFSVLIKQLPFSDIDSHWAKKEICSIYEGGISIGELTDLGRLYFPQRNFTRAEFCVMLARLLGLTVAIDTVVDESVDETVDVTADESVTLSENPETIDESDGINFVDGNLMQDDKVIAASENQTTANIVDADIENENVDDYSGLYEFYADAESIPEWAKHSVNELLKAGMLDEYYHQNGEVRLFDASVPVMRGEVISLIGRLLPLADDNFEFELIDISEQDSNYQNIKNVLFHGLFKGYPDKTLKLEQNLTRAEIAAVFHRLYDIELGLNILIQNIE